MCFSITIHWVSHVQGSEASFTEQRAPLWYKEYTKEDVMWAFIKAMVHYRCRVR